MTPRPAIRRGTGLILPALLLAVAAGCTPTVAPGESRPRATASVARLDAGHPGFSIEEAVSADADARDDFVRAVPLIEQARYDEAIALLKRVIERAPELTAAHINIALAYERAGNAGKAEEHFRTALDRVPGHPVASNAYGLLLRKNGRFSEARAVFESSLERFPEYLPVRRNLGILCELYLDDPAAALEHYEIYSAAAPGDEQVRTWIASLHQRLEGAP